MMSEAIILIGGSGHARVVIDCIRACGDPIAGILDDGIPAGTLVSGVPVQGKVSDWVKYREHRFFIAIGNNRIRQRIAGSMDCRWHTVIHPSAVVSPYARIGSGTVVMPRAVINAYARIGDHCIINTGAIVEHDNQLADFVHISPAAALSGTVCVGEGTHVGIGSAVNNNLNICGGCVIGAGAVVVRNITEPGTYVGIPAGRKA